ncbi:MAG: DivIVA domain-containing protein [Oscillospiraceae bacterium]|nr:DivIVA domain-containing protein [Oscillospiraceae bacterium]
MEGIYFTEEKNGYDKEQVDSYIHKLTEAYQKAYEEYFAMCDKYNDLLCDYKQLEGDIQIGMSSGAIAKTLRNSKKLAQEIIDNAYREETRIIDRTKKNVEFIYKTMEKAVNESQKILTLSSAKEKEDIYHAENKEPGGMLNGIKVTG